MTMAEVPPAIWVGARVLPWGAYVLRIALGEDAKVAFGRFRGGEPIPLPAGDYLYVGSAMGKRGSATLARRVLRHACRSGQAPPHPIWMSLQRSLRRELQEAGFPTELPRPSPKRCFWHIDYLLDRPEAELVQVFLVGSDQRLEASLARSLAADPHTRVVAAGLGARDSDQATHLLRVEAAPVWWQTLPHRLVSLSQGGR
uniref:DUF123 domain-containing protein n=2 Tax=Litorilinea aerophila TaxID=1204385 RepID=A0A540VHQ8_9CHLR